MIINKPKSISIEFTKEEEISIETVRSLLKELCEVMESNDCSEVYCVDYDDSRYIAIDTIETVCDYLKYLTYMTEIS